MILLVLILACVVALAGGFIVGFVSGAVHERARAELRRPLAPHEVLAALKGPAGGRR